MTAQAEARVVCGIQAVRQLLSRPGAPVRQLLLQDDIGQARLARLSDLLETAGCEIVRRPASELHRLSNGGKHQGIVALLEPGGPLEETAALERLETLQNPLVLLLDGVQDPRNFGACLRTANAAGADLVITGRSRTVGLTPAVSKTAAGAAELQALAQVANLARCMAALSKAGLTLFGADAEASVSLYDVDLRGPVGLVLGSEGQGLRQLTRQHCDQLVQLPMAGAVASLNVSVAAGVCLYEAVRQRRAGFVAAGAALR